MKQVKTFLLTIALSLLFISPFINCDQLPVRSFNPYTGQMISELGIGNRSSVVKFGENPDIDDATFVPIWDALTAYTPPTTARLHDVVSDNVADVGTEVSAGTATGGSETTLIDTSATFTADGVAAGDFVLNDTDCALGRVLTIDSETQITVTRMIDPINGVKLFENAAGDSYRVASPAGTGAGVLFIQGLDISRFLQDEFIILNGTTDVPTVKAYSRQFRARVFLTGSTKGAVGTLTSTAQTDGTLTMQVIDGNNQTLMAIFSVPRDKTGFITQWWGSISRDAGAARTSIVRLRVGELDNTSYVTQTRTIATDGKSDFLYPFFVPKVIPGGAEVWIEANSSGANTGVSGGFTVVMIDNR